MAMGEVIMNTPTEPGYYWCRLYKAWEWEPVRLNDSLKSLYAFEDEMSTSVEDIVEWGPKIQFPRQAMDEIGQPFDTIP